MRNMTFPALPDGREYLCIGPNCWGRDVDAKKAVKIAKTNFPHFAGTWKYLLYDVPAGAWVDDMGFNIEWKMPANGSTPDPSREVFRYEPKAKKRT